MRAISVINYIIKIRLENARENLKFEHKSVMPDEIVEILQPKPSGIYLDCTLGGGGHSRRIGELLDAEGFLIGIDRDVEAIEAAKKNLSGLKCKVEIVHGNFSDLEKILDSLDVAEIDGAIFDLGVSFTMRHLICE